MSISTKKALIAFGILTGLYLLPATGIFNDVSIAGIAFNIIYLVTILAAFVLLAIGWFVSPSTSADVERLQEEAEQ